jgi:hypothetical protein
MLLIAWIGAALASSDSGVACPAAPAETVLPDLTCDRGPVAEQCGGPCPELDVYLAEAGSSVLSVKVCDEGWTVVATLAGPESTLWGYFDRDGRVVGFAYDCFLCCCGVCCAGEFLEQRYASRWGVVPELSGCVETATTTAPTTPTTTTPPTTGTTGGSSSPEVDVPAPNRPAERGCGCGGSDAAGSGPAAVLLLGLARRSRRETP